MHLIYYSGRREDGDGMEKPVMVKTSSEMLTGVVLPDTGLALDKLPPISDKVDLLPVIPRSTLVKEKAKVIFFTSWVRKHILLYRKKLEKRT